MRKSGCRGAHEVVSDVPEPVAGRWIVLSDHRRRPSPYFAQLEKYVRQAGLGMEFASSLAEVAGPPGVVNPHRLKRLYRDQDGRPTLAGARAMLRRLRALQRAGWKVVWTLHNLYPIDVPRRRVADLVASHGVGRLADAILCHTRSDAAWMRRRPGVRGLVDVAGWGGLPDRAGSDVPEPVRRLVDRMAGDPRPYLLFGNVSPYKGVRTVVEAFCRAGGHDATLYVVGRCRDPETAEWLRSCGGSRVYSHLEPVSPDHAHLLYAAAAVAVCPYEVTGAQRFFRKAIFPSSVGTAVGFGVPVLAPDLPSIREMVGGHPHVLYPPREGISEAFAGASAWSDDRQVRTPEDDGVRWSAIARCYERTARAFTCGTDSKP